MVHVRSNTLQNNLVQLAVGTLQRSNLCVVRRAFSVKGSTQIALTGPCNPHLPLLYTKYVYQKCSPTVTEIVDFINQHTISLRCHLHVSKQV